MSPILDCPTSVSPSIRGIGATVDAHGVAYRVWAPGAEEISVDIESADGSSRLLSLIRDGEGFYTASDPEGVEGDAYFYVIDGKRRCPDPASRAQRDGVHGRSLVVDPLRFSWSDDAWVRPPFRDLVIYELHMGAFTAGGSFRSAIERLRHLKDLGVTALEIMPVAAAPGSRNWGYDGVLPYAPSECYGTPDDLRALVDASHRLGLAVILDVVYNHFGPDGNHLSSFSETYFDPARHTPWGAAFRFEGPVREFFLGNPAYWMQEFHIDGFRLDATHEIHDPSAVHLLAEMSESIHRLGGYVIGEDDRNSEEMIREHATGGRGFDAVWADDFHHSVRVSQTGERFSYFSDYKGTLSEILTCLEHGWLYRGQISLLTGQQRGSECRQLPPQRFVHCISNHDQVGNRAFGDRIGQSISADAYRMMSALLCLSPYTPMLFMGQEWNATTPFQYFTDHEPELGRQVTAGRRREFAGFPEFAEPSAQRQIPDPQAEETFLRSKLDWTEPGQPAHAGILTLYRECLLLRREVAAFRPETRETWQVHRLPWGAGMLVLEGVSDQWAVVFDPVGGTAGSLAGNWTLVLSSDERRFGGEDRLQLREGCLSFPTRGLVVLTRAAGESTYRGRGTTT